MGEQIDGGLEAVFVCRHGRQRILADVLFDGGNDAAAFACADDLRHGMDGIRLPVERFINVQIIFKTAFMNARRPKREEAGSGFELTIWRVENGCGIVVVVP